MGVEQDNKTIKLHVDIHADHYVHEMLTEYKDYIKKSFRPKRVPISSGVILCPEDEENLHTILQLDSRHAIVGKGRTHEQSSRPYLLLRFKPVTSFREVSLLQRTDAHFKQLAPKPMKGQTRR